MLQDIPTANSDVDVVLRLLTQHLARATPAVQTALASVPWQSAPRDWGAWLVPQLLWVGTPNTDGHVIWHPVAERNRNVLLPYSTGLPPLFASYLSVVRSFQVPLWDGERVWLLPPSLPQNPAFHFNLIASEYIHLYRATGFLAFAESRCGRWVACFDRHTASPGTDSAVYAFQTETLFRLEPRFFQEKSLFELVHPLGVRLYSSFREMLEAVCTGVAPHWEGWQSPHSRPEVNSMTPFDWSGILPPAPKASELCSTKSLQEVGNDLPHHIARIQSKLAILRKLDPAFLIWGAEHHRHRLLPVMTQSERTLFETTEKCTLPEAYAAYVMSIGNGGRGPWRSMRRTENSGAAWAWYWQHTDKFVKGRLQKKFPHTAEWNPIGDQKDAKTPTGYFHNRHVHGTIVIGPAADATLRQAYLLLVVSGPERGHVWSDLRNYGEGITPIVRRGPLSFLAWVEEGIDNDLTKVSEIYGSHVRRVREFVS
jgi:hypothetical protein